MIKNSDFLDDRATIQNFMRGLNASEDIIFDTAEVLYKQNTLNIANLIEKIEDRESVAYLFDVSNLEIEGMENIKSHRLSLFLHRSYVDRYVDTNE